MRRIAPFVLAAALVSLATPVVSGAHPDHCVDPFILSGTGTDRTTRVGTNPGAATCTVDANEWGALQPVVDLFTSSPAHVDTNYTVPGSSHLWVALFSGNTPADFRKPTNSTVTIGSQTTALEFEDNTARGRWESQSVDISGVAPGTLIEAKVKVRTNDDSVNQFQTVTYTRL